MKLVGWILNGLIKRT